MTFYVATDTTDDFDPEAHRWLVEDDGWWLFVYKPSDRWSRAHPDLSRYRLAYPPAWVRRWAEARR